MDKAVIAMNVCPLMSERLYFGGIVVWQACGSWSVMWRVRVCGLRAVPETVVLLPTLTHIRESQQPHASFSW